MYKEILNNYLNNINTLRSFTSKVEMSLLQKEKETIAENSPNLMPLVYAFNQLNPDRFKIDKNLINKLEKKYKNEIEITKEGNENNEVKVTIQGDFSVGLDKALKELQLQKGQIDMLYQNSLISLIVFFELLISQVLHTHITRFPEIMKVNDKSLTLEEIRKLGSIEDAEKYLIDQEVESIMYGSLDKWYKYLTDKIKISVSYFEKNKDLITEIFQRRNIVVHNGGITNSIYFKNVKSELTEGIEQGDRIKINREYIENSILMIENVGVLILLEMWKKAEKKSKDRAQKLMSEGYSLMLENNWGLAAILYDFCTNENGISAEDKLMSKVNYWQCMKWNGQFEVIKKEVDEADFTPYNKKFQLSLLALKENYTEFFEVLEQSVPNDISLDDLKKWPVFSKVRLTNEYNDFIQKVEEPIKEVEFTKNDFIGLQFQNLQSEKILDADTIINSKKRNPKRYKGYVKKYPRRKESRTRKSVINRATHNKTGLSL